MTRSGGGEPREHIAAWVNLQQTCRVIQTRIEGRLEAEADLSWPEYEFLWRVEFSSRRSLQMTEIADRLLASPSGVTRIADRLGEKGLIEREIPSDNRRVVRARVTPLGEAALASADRAFHEILGTAFSAPLADEEVRALRAILRKLLAHNGAWAAERCDPPFGGLNHDREDPGEPG